MKISKHLEYGFLFTLYVCRAGRATTEVAAQTLNLSHQMLQQIARRLKVAGVMKSIRGPGGGYEVVGEPTVLDLFNALQPVKVVATQLPRPRSSEARAYFAFTVALAANTKYFLDTPVRAVMESLTTSELNTMNSVSAEWQGN